MRRRIEIRTAEIERVETVRRTSPAAVVYLNGIPFAHFCESKELANKLAADTAVWLGEEFRRGDP